MERVYKGPKKQAVQLTSLLDLLFVMIFVSLIQQKEVTPAKKETPKKPVVAKVKPKAVTPTPVEKTFYMIRSTFNFYATNSTPNIPNGSYIMSGSYNKKTGELRLGGVGWIKRPKHYDMVPLSGKIDSSQKFFRGRIEFQGCKEFILERKTKGASNSPISGDWVGSYSCTQGSTGLTLTIQ